MWVIQKKLQNFIRKQRRASAGRNNTVKERNSEQPTE
jgi:hypothetical protein